LSVYAVRAPNQRRGDDVCVTSS